jgi:hypothetical protein
MDKAQSAGLYYVNIKNLATDEEKFLGEIPQDGSFQTDLIEATQMFMTKASGIATEARAIVSPSTLTTEVIADNAILEFLGTAFIKDGDVTVFGVAHGCRKKEFELRLHPKCYNKADTSEDIVILRCTIDVTKSLNASIEGKKMLTIVVNIMAKETVLPAPADLTIIAGSGSAKVLYWKAVATNGTGDSVPNATELNTTVEDDGINIVLPIGATGITLYAGEATGPATNIKYYNVTNAEITAGKVENVGTLYDSTSMVDADSVPSVATGYYYKSAEIG